MTVRFLFWTTAVLLIVSGVAGWIFFGEREPDPEELRLKAYQARLESERQTAESSTDPATWTGYARTLLNAPESLKDPKAVFAWFKKGAEKGYPPAQVGMGDMYNAGIGVHQDHHRAQEWYGLAASLSQLPEALFRIGEGYFRGLGRPQDYGAALSYYRAAAAQGHPIAQYILGSMYEAGWGIERDLIIAWVWYKRALPSATIVNAHEEGYDVQQSLDRITAKMNRSQLEEAKRRVAAAAN